jgi:dynein heavy chain 1
MICRGEKKQTNDHRALVSDLTRGIIPRSWVLYKIPGNATVTQWINDFCQRVKQLDDVSRSVSNSGATSLRSATIWLGGLFNPE